MSAIGYGSTKASLKIIDKFCTRRSKISVVNGGKTRRRLPYLSVKCTSLPIQYVTMQGVRVTNIPVPSVWYFGSNVKIAGTVLLLIKDRLFRSLLLNDLFFTQVYPK